MHRIFRKDQVLTIPNLLSVIRLALIPLIVWLYIGKQEYSAAVAVILISGATDIIDGFIARKFNMVSDLGKILDPVADKLTQATVILCLTVKYRWMRGLIVLFVVKEIIMAVLGYMGVVLNAPISDLNLLAVSNAVDIPVIITVTHEGTDIASRLQHGAAILNIACGKETPNVVRKIRSEFPNVPLVASGGKTNESIYETIVAGANAITYTPPSTQELFKELMAKYRT